MPVQVDCLEPAPLDPRAEQTMVPMRDGVRLATDLYLPDSPGHLPAVLVRLPYDKCGRYTFMPQLAPWFTERGYAFVVQDVRGKYRSEGETMPFVHEIDDGYDSLDWIVSQPWSSGAVGMWGDSYYGFTQWAAVACGHPALKAIVPRVTGTNFLKSLRWWGDGVGELYMAEYLALCWLDGLIYESTVDWSRRPLAGVFDEVFATVGRRAAAFDRFVLGARDQGLSIYPDGRHPFEHLIIPVLHSVGWFDNILPHSMRDYQALCARPDRARQQYLVADAIDHECYHLRQAPLRPADDHDTDDAALQKLLPSLTAPALDFFDVFLRGRGRPDDVPRVRWFLGHDDWRQAPAWPPPDARELRLYLAAPGRATQSAPGGVLAPAPDSARSRVTWVHDPEQLVPSALVDPFAQIKEWPDERGIESRDDVLTFTTESLGEPLDLVGPAEAVLSVGSTASSMHVMVKVLDVAPDGSARALMRGQLRVEQPGADRSCRVDLSHTGYRLRAGHSLRLHVASSDFPLYLWHPGTGEDPWSAERGAQNEQSLVTGGSRSYLSLTVLDRGR